MCLIGVALHAHPRWPLVLVANRDEFHDRPSAPFAAWDDVPGAFGGRDVVAGGSWLALRGHRLAAVTNVRRMQAAPPGAPSRGWLVRDFVAADHAAERFLADLARSAGDYAGFNLLLVDGSAAWLASNRSPVHGTAEHVAPYRWQALTHGIHVVSNATLDTPWPKSQRLHAALAAWCRTDSDDLEGLFDALSDQTPVADADLPDTGLPLARERLLAPAFIRDPVYGTRASTVVAYDLGGRWQAQERRFGPDGRFQGDSHYRGD